MWSAHRQLHCVNGCPPERFEALNAPVFVDPAGRLLEFDDSHVTYVCAACGGVALDVAAAAREMRSQDVEGDGDTLTCPGCGTEMLPPEDDPSAPIVECPMCTQRFTLEEGSPHLLGGSSYRGDPDLN